MPASVVNQPDKHGANDNAVTVASCGDHCRLSPQKPSGPASLPDAMVKPFDFAIRRAYGTITMLCKPDSALVITGHGSTINPDSSAPTWDLAEDIRRRGVFGEVHCAFWKEEPSLRQVLHCVDRGDVYVVPNFISEGYFTKTVVPRELGLGGAVTRIRSHTVKYR